jgi:hypothetical protein
LCNPFPLVVFPIHFTHIRNWPSSTVKMEAASSPESLVITYKITQCHNSEYHNHSFDGHDNLGSDVDGDHRAVSGFEHFSLSKIDFVISGHGSGVQSFLIRRPVESECFLHNRQKNSAYSFNCSLGLLKHNILLQN